jgi:ABC-type Zn uptake system ZnuABC Zn-binding protein ZnuA
MAANILGAIAGLGIENICSGIGKLAKDIKEVLTGEMSPENKAKIELQATELAKQVEDLNFKAQQM